MRDKRILLISIGVIVVVLVVAIVLFLSFKNEPQVIEEVESIDVEELKSNFNELFNNVENEYVGTLYDIEEEKTGKYKIKAYIPYFNIGNEIDNNINKEINDIFVNKLLQIINESEIYTIFNMDYSVNINDNVISLAIRCVYKEGNNAQRTIIKTYNYDIENQKEVNIMELIPESKVEDIQNQINKEIEKQIKREEAIAQQGYNIYRRDKESDIYILQNATEFYIQDDILYIIYCYGNSNYTSEMDLIINKI